MHRNPLPVAHRRFFPILVIAISSLFLAAAMATASGSSRGGVSSGPTGPTATDPFLITSVVKAAIVSLGEDGKTILVRDLESEKLREIELHPELDLRAKSKKDFGGRRKLEASDLAAGQLVKLTIRDADGAVLKLRVEALTET